MFKRFKAMAENQSGRSIEILRTGGRGNTIPMNSSNYVTKVASYMK